MDLHAIARRVVPPDLLDNVFRSFEVPQHGSYHWEGPWMGAHIERVIEALREVEGCRFHDAVPGWTWPLLTNAARRFSRWLELYALLHDLDKATCMTFQYDDGTGKRRKVVVTWEEWLRMKDGCDDGPSLELCGGNLAAFCEARGIVQISYFQDLNRDRKRIHGRVTARRLSGYRRIPGFVKRAIATHEVAFQFRSGPGNQATFERHFGRMRTDEIWFCLLANYADQVGSHREGGRPDIEAFLALLEAARVHFEANE